MASKLRALLGVGVNDTPSPCPRFPEAGRRRFPGLLFPMPRAPAERSCFPEWNPFPIPRLPFPKPRIEAPDRRPNAQG